MIQPDQRSSHLHSPARRQTAAALEGLEANGNKAVMFRQRTINDPPLVRKYANVLAQRLSEGDGHLVCFPILKQRHRGRGGKDRKVRKINKELPICAVDVCLKNNCWKTMIGMNISFVVHGLPH